MTEFPHVEMTEENKEKLVQEYAEDLASSSSSQYEAAREGFVGVNQLTQEQFNREFTLWVGKED